MWITETNTDTDAHSNQSYPSGWYLQALDEISVNGGPRFWALCWFVDRNYGVSDPNTQGWWFDSLTQAINNCAYANNDFNSALTNTSY
jgi:hypothetical protein